MLLWSIFCANLLTALVKGRGTARRRWRDSYALLVILSEAKNLLRITIGFKILRFAQNDKGWRIAAAADAMYGVPTILQSA